MLDDLRRLRGINWECALFAQESPLRHTFATRAAMAGVDLVTLAAMLGHSGIQMVLRPARPTEEHQINAMKRVEEFDVGKRLAEYESRSVSPIQ